MAWHPDLLLEVDVEFKRFSPNPWIRMALLLPRGARARRLSEKQKKKAFQQNPKRRAAKKHLMVRFLIERMADWRAGKTPKVLPAKPQKRIRVAAKPAPKRRRGKRGGWKPISRPL